MYRFIDRKRIVPFNGDFVVVGGYIYSSPTEDILKLAGYKSLVETEMPEIEDNQYVESYYEDCGDTIEIRYEIMIIEEIPEEEVFSEE